MPLEKLLKLIIFTSKHLLLHWASLDTMQSLGMTYLKIMVNNKISLHVGIYILSPWLLGIKFPSNEDIEIVQVKEGK